MAKVSNDCPLLNSETYRNVYSNFKNELLTLQEVNKAVTTSKIPNGLSPTDFPRQIISKFNSFFSVPLHKIYNCSLKTNVYPDVWKIENVTLIPKCKAPENVNDLRPISLTPHYSKVFEGILRNRILNDIGSGLDKKQYGTKGGRVEYCLMDMINEILATGDMSEQSYSILFSLDFSKAFNRFSHPKILAALIKLGLRRSLIPLVASYLQNRSLVVRWKESFSKAFQTDIS